MSIAAHLQVRDHRDRLLDLLEYGFTHPLRDLPLSSDVNTVAYNTPAQIAMQYSQSGVLYQLHFDGEAVERPPAQDDGPGIPIEEPGTGSPIVLETYPLQEDTTFQILATKQISGNEAYLHQSVTIKVGLDQFLDAFIRAAPFLDPINTNPSPSDPRLIDHGTRVEVEIVASQEGVDYRLVYLTTAADSTPEEVVISENDVRGDLGNIVLKTRPLFEDIDIRIRATKTFDPDEQTPSQSSLLHVTLPLRIRANPLLSLSVEPAPVVDFAAAPTFLIEDTQRSASYQIYTRQIGDQDIVHGDAAEEEIFSVPVDGEPDVQIRRPGAGSFEGRRWQPPAGWTALGDEFQGTGDEVGIPLPALRTDSLFIVEAIKVHQIDTANPDSGQVVSSLPIQQPVGILTAPNPEVPLTVQIEVQNGQTASELQLLRGEPGTFYFLRTALDGPAIGLPGYFHKQDDDEPDLNKGIGQLNLEVDLVVAATPAGGAGSPARQPAMPPRIELDPLALPVTLHILARKAQTRVASFLTRQLTLPLPPTIRLENEQVDSGSFARILVDASLPGDTYQPFLADGTPIRQARRGNGNQLVFRTDPIEQLTRIQVRIRRPDDGPPFGERVVWLQVSVTTP